jgi:hypothetical protein
VVLKRLAKLALVLALTCYLGLHWAVLQSVAWVGMVVSYSQDLPLSAALSQTFDGKHPCSLCQQIAQGRQSEKRPACGQIAKRLDYSYLESAFVFVAPVAFWEADWPDTPGWRLTQPPLLPPPKARASQS